MSSNGVGNTNKVVRTTVVHCGVVLAAGLLLAGCTKSEVSIKSTGGSSASSGAGTKASTAAKIEPVSVDGYKKVVESFKGHVVLVDFWATWCGPCKQQFPHTMELHKQYGEQGLKVVTVSMDEEENRSRAAEFLGENGATSTTNLVSETGGSDEAYEGFEITGSALPHYKVFGKDGTLLKSFGGDVDHPFGAHDIDAEVKAALAK